MRCHAIKSFHIIFTICDSMRNECLFIYVEVAQASTQGRWVLSGSFLLMRPLSYVGVIWFVLHVLQLLLVTFTQQNLCCMSKTMMKHMQNWVEN